MNRLHLIRGSLILSALIFAGVALAQDPSPRRTDPLTPPAEGGGGSVWSTVSIVGQAPGSALGSLAVEPSGRVFVWSMANQFQPLGAAAENVIDPERTDPGTPLPPPDGGGSPQPPGTNAMVSTLYAYNGISWTPSLRVTGETGATVFIARSGEIYAATDLPDGSIHLYRNDGCGWHMESLPAGVHGPAGQMAGEQTLYFRTGGAILRHTANHWQVDFSCPNLGMSGGIVYLSRNQVMVPCVSGVHLFDGHHWTWNPEAVPAHVNGAWGGRDQFGELHMFAGGSNDTHNQLEIFQYIETTQDQLAGDFHCVVEHPDGPCQVGSVANRVWGFQVHDVYVTGAVDGYLHLFHFDGSAWKDIAPEPIHAASVDVAGDANGVLWVSMTDGRLLRRQGEHVSPLRVPLPTPLGRSGEDALASVTGLEVRGAASGPRTIAFSLPDDRDATLAVFDLAGRRIETLERGYLTGGIHQVTWNASRVPNGMYFCRLEAGSLMLTRKLVVSR